MHKSLKPLLCMLLAALLLLSACGGDDTPPGAAAAIRDKTLRLPLLTLPYTFNPDAMAEGAEAISENLFSRVVRLNAGGELIPDLAAEWSFNEDCTVLQIKLNSAIYWHDGKLCTTEDVAYTLGAIREQHGVLAAHMAGIEDITVINSLEMEIAFTSPSPFFLYTLAEEGASILPKHLYEGQDWLTAGAVTKPVGTGPFKFVERTDSSVVLERYADYFGGATKLNRLEFKLYGSVAEAQAAFDAGEIDLLTTGMPLSAVNSYKQAGNRQVIEMDDATRIVLVFNVAGGIFHNNPSLRRAVACSVDREAILAEGMQGVGAVSYSFLSPLYQDAISATATVPARNLTRAAEQLDSRYTADANGTYVHLTLSVYDAEPYPEIAAVLKKNLAEVGIEVTVIQMDLDEWQETVFTQGDFEMTLYGGYQGPYPEAILHRLAIGGQLNFTGYLNKDLSDKLYQAIGEPSVGRRNSLLRDAQDILAAQLPFLPLTEWYTVVVAHSYVQNPPQTAAEVSPNCYARTVLVSG